jgi:hypothetical protein
MLAEVRGWRMDDGIYHVEFMSAHARMGEGIVVVSQGTLNGGDLRGYTYQGRLRITGHTFTGRLRIARFHPQAQSVFGPVGDFDLDIAGSVTPSSSAVHIAGTMAGQPQHRISIIGRKVRDLA